MGIGVEAWSAPTAAKFAIEDDDYVLKLRRDDFYNAQRVRLVIHGSPRATMELLLNEVDNSIVGLTIISCDDSDELILPQSLSIQQDTVPVIAKHELNSPLALPVSCYVNIDGLFVRLGSPPALAHVHRCGATCFLLADDELVGISYSGDLREVSAFRRYFNTQAWRPRSPSLFSMLAHKSG